MKSWMVKSLMVLSTLAPTAHAFNQPYGILLRQAPLHNAALDGRKIPATRLSMYGHVYSSGKSTATRLVLTEDTGIRCITTPCPSSRDTVFRIERTETQNQITRYTAIEELSAMDDQTDRSSPRTLTLTDYSGAPHVRVRYVWFVQIADAEGNVTKLGGNPQFTELSAVLTNGGDETLGSISNE